MVAKPQSIVLMKKTANALAPALVCRVASAGITGGRSPGRVFGPVVGTSAGTRGDGDGELEIVDRTGVVVGPMGIVLRGPCMDPVHAATTSPAKTANPPIRCTRRMLPARAAEGNLADTLWISSFGAIACGWERATKIWSVGWWLTPIGANLHEFVVWTTR